MVLAGRFVMAPLVCKHCGSASFVRNGMADGHQRYRCKACGRNFTATPARGQPPAMKARAILLYGLANVSQGMIAKPLGVSHVAVYKWVRAAGEGTPAPSAPPSSGIVHIDEMGHFVGEKKTRSLFSGSGVLSSCDQGRHQLAEGGFAPAAGVVHELEEAQVQRQLFLQDAAVQPKPGAQQRPEALHRVNVHLAEAIAVLVARILAAPVADGLVPVTQHHLPAALDQP